MSWFLVIKSSQVFCFYQLQRLHTSFGERERKKETQNHKEISLLIDPKKDTEFSKNERATTIKANTSYKTWELKLQNVQTRMQKKGQETKKILLTPRLQVPSGASAQLVFSRTISVFVLGMVQNCENKSNTRLETSLCWDSALQKLPRDKQIN